MPIYAYDGGTGPLCIDNVGWITTTTTTTTTSSWYPFGGATYSSPTVATITQGTPSRILYHDAQWIAFQNRAAATRRNQENQCVGLGDHIAPPASPAIIRERAEAETRRVNKLAARNAEQLARLESERKRKVEAGARARELLLEHLTPEQRRMFEANNWFIVEGGKSKTKYRIQGNRVVGNIDVLTNGGAWTHRLCCHCDHSIPTHDHHLAQKLMLEHAEDDFLRIANRQ